MKRMRWIVIAPVFLFLVAAGCSQVGKKATQEKPAVTADKAVEKVSKKLAANRPDYAYAALPPSYRKDVEGIVKEFAGTADAEIYNRNFTMLQKVVRILETKKSMILAHPTVKGNVDTKELSRDWDAVVKLASIAAESDLSNLANLEKLDVEEFLATTGSRFVEQLQVVSKLAPTPSEKKDVDVMTLLSGCTAEIVETEGETARVRIEAPGVEPEEQAFVKVEGHWIPKELADNWEGYVANARAKLELLASKKDSANKALYLSRTKLIDGVLDQLLGAKTPEEFNAGIIQGMAVVAGMIAGGQGVPPGGGEVPDF